MKYLSILLLFAIGLSSCEKTSPEDSTIPFGVHYSEPPFTLESPGSRFAEGVAYGEENAQSFDIFIPESAEPTGILIFIHGGGFATGDKAIYSETSRQRLINDVLNQSCSFVSINYRLLGFADQDGVLKCLEDVKYGLQFIRYHADEFNLDKDNIVLSGTSAGASTAIWIATQDDLADVNNEDPVLKESTRVKAIALQQTQATLDIDRWEEVFAAFDGFNIQTLIEDNMFLRFTLLSFYGISSLEEYNSDDISVYRSKVDMLDFISADDPEIWCENIQELNDSPIDASGVLSTGKMYHHFAQAKSLQQACDAAGTLYKIKYGNPILFDNTGTEDFYGFCIRKLNE